MTFLPPLSSTVKAWTKLLLEGILIKNFLVSLLSLITGFSLALILGILTGILMGRFRKVEDVLNMYINALMSAPTISYIPVLVLWFGLGIYSRIAVVFMFAYFVIAVNTYTGVKNVDKTLIEMARSFGARDKHLFIKLTLPASMPMIMAGVRLGMGRAVKGMVTAEMLLTVVGLGSMIMYYGSAFAADYLFAVVLTIVIFAILITELIHRIDRWIMPWRQKTF